VPNSICPKGRRLGVRVERPCSPRLVSRWGGTPRCLFCRGKVNVSRETCDHHVRIANETDSRKGAPSSFCGLCGEGLNVALTYKTEFQKRWGEGKVLSALPPGHPDYLHTNQKSALRAAERHGISVETGTFKTEADRQKAWKDVAKLRDYSKSHVGVTPGGSNENRRLKVPRIHPGMGKPGKPLKSPRKAR
jgi:hypothetical protein